MIFVSDLQEEHLAHQIHDHESEPFSDNRGEGWTDELTHLGC